MIVIWFIIITLFHFKSYFSSRRRQRRRQQQHHSFIMWCVSKLNFMIISFRAKSKKNYLQNSSQLRLLRKYAFASFMSCDANLIKTYKTCLIKHVMCRLIKLSCATDHVIRKQEKCTYETNVIMTNFEDNFLLISLEAR